jgi:hypothetical protein
MIIDFILFALMLIKLGFFKSVNYKNYEGKFKGAAKIELMQLEK